MTNIIIAFTTGLTAGGLSCMAVQGGLLTTSIARQAELDLQAKVANQVSQKVRKKADKTKPTTGAKEDKTPHGALSITLFLGAKLLAYTLFGFLLGGLGSFFILSPRMQASLQIVIGIFMLGNALRMLNIHPIFRYFTLEPPRFITSYIRKVSKQDNAAHITPLFLGLLTVFIPCGITQSMMALAVASGNAFAGAAIMAAFTLGTTPLFFGLAFLATRLGGRLEKGFLTVVAVLSLGIGLFTINTGFRALGMPLFGSPAFAGGASQFGALPRIVLPGFASETSQDSNLSTLPLSENNVLEVTARPGNYQPNLLRAKAGEPIRLSIVSDGAQGCVRAFTIPLLGILQILPENGTTVIELPPQPKGQLVFMCSMGMYGGYIYIEEEAS
jgi:uncharacterized protein